MNIHFQINNKEDAFTVRNKVFVEEQGFTQEFDDIDDRATHVTLYANEELAGTARIYADENHPRRYIFGRLAVLPHARKQGYGGLLLTEAENQARKAGATEMHLHAQCRVVPFYESFGYSSYGPVELDEHVEHVWMKKALL